MYANSLAGSRKQSAAGSVAPLAEEEGADLDEVMKMAEEIHGIPGESS
jgi:hypothetical protein